MMQIWGRANSINVQKVLWLCGELGLAFERIDAGGQVGGLDTPEYRMRNPNALVPTLVDDHAVIWESNAILRYIGSRYATGPLWPDEPAERAMSDKWLDWQLTTLWPDMRTIFIQLVRLPEAERDAALLKRAHQNALSAWRIVEREIGTNGYIAGDTLTLADIALGVVVYRWFALNIDRPSMPALERWYASLTTRQPFTQYVMLPLS